MERNMFYEAGPLIFRNAKRLRNNLTDTEMRLWGYLPTKPFGYKFRRQHPVGFFIADFYCHALHLIIEVDGSIHLEEEIQKQDIERQQLLENDGIKVIRFTTEDILQRYETVINKINTLLEEKENFSSISVLKTPPSGGWGV